MYGRTEFVLYSSGVDKFVRIPSDIGKRTMPPVKINLIAPIPFAKPAALQLHGTPSR